MSSLQRRTQLRVPQCLASPPKPSLGSESQHGVGVVAFPAGAGLTRTSEGVAYVKP